MSRSTYRIKTIFGPTLQGEGSQAGRVVKFLRFAGCNRWTGREEDREKAATVCRFCDTDFRGGEPLSADEIVKRLNLIPTQVVVISGGEATLQLDRAILQAIKDAGHEIHLETNGSTDISELRDLIDHVTMSPKQSRAETKLKECDDLKVLYPDIHPGMGFEEFRDFPAKHRFLQAVWDQNYDANLRATICRLYGNPSWRLSLQTHKITGVE